MDTTRGLQQFGESYVKRRLQKSGHLILGTNVRRGRFEFDIISFLRSRQSIFIHEVRTVTLQDDQASDIMLVFPQKKLKTLVFGAHAYYPNSCMLLHYLRVGKTTQKYSVYRLEQFLSYD